MQMTHNSMDWFFVLSHLKMDSVFEKNKADILEVKILIVFCHLVVCFSHQWISIVMIKEIVRESENHHSWSPPTCFFASPPPTLLSFILNNTRYTMFGKCFTFPKHAWQSLPFLVDRTLWSSLLAVCLWIWSTHSCPSLQVSSFQRLLWYFSLESILPLLLRYCCTWTESKLLNDRIVSYWSLPLTHAKHFHQAEVFF